MSMKFWHWITATTVAAVTMASYIHNYVYPRTEGQALASEVSTLHQFHREDIREIKKELRDLNEWLRDH